MSVEQQEQAATAYWQSLIARDRAARQVDAQTQQQAQGAGARDEQRLRQDAARARRAQQGQAQSYY